MRNASTEGLKASDFTEADVANILQMCKADTKGEETWHGFDLENGKMIDVDCYDEILVNDENPTGFNLTAYVVEYGEGEDKHITRTDLAEFNLPNILYKDMGVKHETS